MQELNIPDMTTLAWRFGQPVSQGRLRETAQDFQVQEDLGFEPDGEGEHLLVWLRKTGCNTPFVAEQLARFAGISPRSVTYCGLKDRHAVTEQWFCLHLPGKTDPDFSQFMLEGCEILRCVRHLKKMRIGIHKGNFFTLVLRGITQMDALLSRLPAIKQQGVPNYFGEQRFGHQGNNLRQALRWASNEITVKERNKRSFYLSATRSALFNLITSQRLAENSLCQVMEGDALQLAGRGSWFVAKQEELASVQQRVLAGELLVTAPLAGDGLLGTQQQAEHFEQQCLQPYAVLLDLLHRERLQPARRAMILQPQQMSWQVDDSSTLTLQFWLPAGGFATSVVRELITPETNFSDIPESE
jgi:tRNA pseudouridine13 synthase